MKKALRKTPTTIRFADARVKNNLSESTVSEVYQDYSSLVPEIYRLQCLVSEKSGNISIADMQNFIRTAGHCKTMVINGYNSPDRLQTIIDEYDCPEGKRRARPTMLARAFIRQKWNLEKSTVDSYIKRGRGNARRTKAKTRKTP